LKQSNRWLKRSSHVLLVLALVVGIGSQSFAQSASSAPAEKSEHQVGGPRRQLATIIFAGLGGAVLGLSTLSFYGRPQDKLSNIAIGFAVGVISGTVLVTYKAATNPSEFYGSRPWIEFEREQQLAQSPASEGAAPTILSYSFDL
jgi:hypothetical protein